MPRNAEKNFFELFWCVDSIKNQAFVINRYPIWVQNEHEKVFFSAPWHGILRLKQWLFRWWFAPIKIDRTKTLQILMKNVDFKFDSQMPLQEPSKNHIGFWSLRPVFGRKILYPPSVSGGTWFKKGPYLSKNIGNTLLFFVKNQWFSRISPIRDFLSFFFCTKKLLLFWPVLGA